VGTSKLLGVDDFGVD